MLLTKPKTFLTALVTGGLVWATASFAENITVTDMAGRTVDVPHGAERIILGEGRMMYAVAPLMTKDPFKRILGWCRVALKWALPQSVWRTILRTGRFRRDSGDFKEALVARERCFRSKR